MGLSRIVTATGAIDGTNTVFSTGEPYTAGYTRYILNGRFHGPGTDPDFTFTESNPATGEITVSVPPRIDDVVQIFFVDRRPIPPSPIQRLQAVIPSPSRVQGVLRPVMPTALVGRISTDRAAGTLQPTQPTRLAGVIRSTRLTGRIRED
jgi:hypothetical protein